MDIYMNTTEAAQSAPPDGLVGGGGKETVSVGLEFALKKMASRSEPQMTENYDPRRFLADKQAV